MTAFNTSKFIKEALDSIKNQTYKDWELIFIDDGSKDKTVDVVKDYVKKNHIIRKTRLFKHEKNYGYGSALKNAIEYGSGELVAIIDSDDYLTDDKAFEIMVNYHQKYENAALIYSNFYEFHNNKTKLSKRVCSDILKGDTYLGTFNKKGQYSGSKYYISHLKVFKRSYYDLTVGVNYNLLKAVDKDVIIKLEEVGGLVHVPEFLYAHRVHPENISSSYNKKTDIMKKHIFDLKMEMYMSAGRRRGLI